MTKNHRHKLHPFLSCFFLSASLCFTSACFCFLPLFCLSDYPLPAAICRVFWSVMGLFTNILICITLCTWRGWLQYVLVACFGLWNISRRLKNACVIWHRVRQYSRASQVAQWVKNLPAMQEMQENVGSMPGLGRSPGGGHGNPLWYSCLENPMDRGAWRATVHGVAQNRTWQKLLSPQAQAVFQVVGCSTSLGPSVRTT